METFIMLLQVTYSIEYFIAFIAPKFAFLFYGIWALTTLWTVSLCFNCPNLVREDAVEPIRGHGGVAGYVCKGIMGQVVPMAPHVITRTVYYGLVLGVVLSTVLGWVWLVSVTVSEILMRQVHITIEVMWCHHWGWGWGGQGLECCGVTRVAPLV